MPRFRLLIEYDGGPYLGWQVQDASYGRSVQGEIMSAIERFAGERTSVNGAGRTDRGVHATGQVAHIDLSRDWRTDVVRDAVNAYLRPNPISIRAVQRVPDDFDARFSAIRRHYLYRIINTRSNLALDCNRAWRVPRRLDDELMRQGAARLLGHHDFTTFRSTECQAKSPVRTLERFDITRQGDEIRCVIAARSFLHNQVRSMVGTLEMVGAGKWTPDDVSAALAAKDRRACGMVAPPEALYLTQVDYPES